MSLLARIVSVRGVFFGLRAEQLDPDPIRQFQRWFRLARRGRCPWPTSVCLATVAPDGTPSARMMLLKGADEQGFSFFTHYVGRKARELDACPRAALVFHWIELLRQVRVEGRVEKLGPEESDAYFASRARLSQIGA